MLSNLVYVGLDLGSSTFQQVAITTKMGHEYFLMRGLNKVGAEMSLTVLSYQLKRVINITSQAGDRG
jgi:hypothetical protein